MLQNKQILLQPINQKKPNPQIRIGPCCFPTHLTQKNAKISCTRWFESSCTKIFFSNVSPFRYIEFPFRKCLSFFGNQKNPNSQKGILLLVSGIQGANVPGRVCHLVRGFHFHQDIYKVDEQWVNTKLKWHKLKHDPPSNNNNNNRQLHPNRFAGASPTVTSGLNFSKAPKTTSSSKALAKAKPKSTQRLRLSRSAAKRWWWHRCVRGPLGFSLPGFFVDWA